MDILEALALVKGELHCHGLNGIDVVAIGYELVARQGLRRAKGSPDAVFGVAHRSASAEEFWLNCAGLGLIWPEH